MCMTTRQLGLLLNLLGSLFMGLHILGKKTLATIELKIRQFPHKMISWLSELTLRLLTILIRISTKHQKSLRSYRPKRWVSRAQKYITVSYKGIPNALLDKPEVKLFLQFVMEKALITTFLHIIIRILVFPVWLPIKIVIIILEKAQQKFHSQSILGLFGVFLLIVGFLLQFFTETVK